ncbi:hypothetical protein ACROYT_G021097 [Oculina patagonica]
MNSLATSVCDHFKSVGVVCPLSLHRGLFTVGAIDNIDHNPSSTTAQGSFHGTGIILFQFPKHDSEVSQQVVQGETCLLKHIEQHLHEELTKGIYLSWAAYHASVTVVSNPLPCLGSLLPSFDEKAATVAMMKHGMFVMKKATEPLNPGQIPVTVCDQPLFAIAKFVQWNWPSTHGENLHGSALDKNQACTPDNSSGFAKLDGQHDDEEFQKWHDGMIKNSPTYKFWFLIMQMELTVLAFVKAHRENNLSLYVEALESLAPWFFALDHTNYARWLPIHIRDMKCLPGAVQDDLKNLCWVISKSF